MVIGFGKCEVRAATEIIKQCRDEGTAPVQESYSEAAASNDEMSREDAPERYTQFWVTEHESPRGDRIRQFTMHHINRRHAFSPDGWALLITRWIEVVEHDGTTLVFKEC